MKWQVLIDLKNVDDDLTESGVSAMVAAAFDLVWKTDRGTPTVPMVVENIKVRKPKGE